MVALKYSLQPSSLHLSHTLLMSGGPFVTPAPLAYPWMNCRPDSTFCETPLPVA